MTSLYDETYMDVITFAESVYCIKYAIELYHPINPLKFALGTPSQESLCNQILMDGALSQL